MPPHSNRPARPPLPRLPPETKKKGKGSAAAPPPPPRPPPPPQAVVDSVPRPVAEQPTGPGSDASSISDQWIRTKSDLHNTIVRYDFTESAPKPGPRIVLASTLPNCRERFSLKQGTNRVGRKDVEVVLNVPEISRHHATIEIQGSEIVLTDEDSANGTFVNGRRIRQSRLEDGDVVVFARDFRFVLVLADGADYTPTVRVANLLDANEELRVLERERRQLALLFQISMRFLRAGPDDDSLSILFDILPRVVSFETAFVAMKQQSGYRFFGHPQKPRLTRKDFEWLVEQSRGVPIIDDEPGSEVTLSALRVASRAIIPLTKGDCLVLLSGRPHEYSHQVDFLTVLADIYLTAATRGPLLK